MCLDQILSYYKIFVKYFKTFFLKEYKCENMMKTISQNYIYKKHIKRM